MAIVADVEDDIELNLGLSIGGIFRKYQDEKFNPRPSDSTSIPSKIELCIGVNDRGCMFFGDFQSVKGQNQNVDKRKERRELQIQKFKKKRMEIEPENDLCLMNGICMHNNAVGLDSCGSDSMEAQQIQNTRSLNEKDEHRSEGNYNAKAADEGDFGNDKKNTSLNCSNKLEHNSSDVAYARQLLEVVPSADSFAGGDSVKEREATVTFSVSAGAAQNFTSECGGIHSEFENKRDMNALEGSGGLPDSSGRISDDERRSLIDADKTEGQEFITQFEEKKCFPPSLTTPKVEACVVAGGVAGTKASAQITLKVEGNEDAPSLNSSPSIMKAHPSSHHFGFGSLRDSSALPKMPCVFTTGPNGKTITGFLYRYTKAEVTIVCVCHGRSFSPADFVRHAGVADVSHPLRHIVVVPTCSFR